MLNAVVIRERDRPHRHLPGDAVAGGVFGEAVLAVLVGLEGDDLGARAGEQTRIDTERGTHVPGDRVLVDVLQEPSRRGPLPAGVAGIPPLAPVSDVVGRLDARD